MLVVECSEWSKTLMKPINTVCWRKRGEWFVCLRRRREWTCGGYNGGVSWWNHSVLSALRATEQEICSRRLHFVFLSPSLLFLFFSTANIHKVNNQSRLFIKAPQWNAGKVCWDIFMVREASAFRNALQQPHRVSVTLSSHIDTLALGWSVLYTQRSSFG